MADVWSFGCCILEMAGGLPWGELDFESRVCGEGKGRDADDLSIGLKSTTGMRGCIRKQCNYFYLVVFVFEMCPSFQKIISPVAQLYFPRHVLH